MPATPPLPADRLKRMNYRAWHRGTREADYMIGGFFDAHHAGWDAAALDWFDAVLDAEDVDIMAWALGTAQPPAELANADLIAALRRLDYIAIS